MFDTKQYRVQSRRMGTPQQKQHGLMRDEVRAMKAQGMTNRDIGTQLGISKSLAHYYSRASVGEKLCPRCARPWAKKK